MTHWDTVFQVGTADMEDDLFANPNRVLLWNEGVAVSDRTYQHVLMLDSGGTPQWTAGRRGEGPKEFKNVTDLAIAPNGNLWALDPGNARINEINIRGEFVRQISLIHLPTQPSEIAVAKGRVILAANSPFHTIVEIAPGDARILAISPFRWTEPLDPTRNLLLALGHNAVGDVVAAFRLGPGFNVFRGDSVEIHRFVEHVPFALKVNRQIRDAGADTARFGALRVVGHGSEFMMLFGGRPFRKAHAAEPTNTIDVYGPDGVYLRSYRLPVDAVTFTSDGENFYVVQHDPYPSLLKLQPRMEHAANDGH